MAADEEAAIAAIVESFFSVIKEKKKVSRLLIFPISWQYSSQRRGDTSLEITGYTESLLEIHSQQPFYFTLGNRMDGMAFFPFRNRNAE